METEYKEPQNVNTALQNEMPALDGTNSQTLAKLPPAEEPDQLQMIGAKISQFLAEIPQDLNKFYSAYKTPIIALAVFLASFVILRVALAMLAAVNDIPLVSPIFELIGIGYTGWFVFRYLLKAPTRKELAAEIASFKREITGKNTTETLN
ncbi:CAAD domain-containing protein [Plectonema cf. radiosum LEGE 06105]|uniref:CAAD domain-containing protein n=1 Tax=Plectonema cf. radiosum LEGE 06105 TaxID=945769 RepID=A0A8J7F6F8_9CYAN|nr:CAAD domain-containing protein [Plectonema radiosum]MBE9215882.1 CAAD domain-containing protein [Plectonema cf. radiosum LEGE 06105]